jgi:Response regulator receiver domain.
MENTKILVVDDDKAIAGAIEKLLVMEGYEVIKAYNGMEALDALVNNDVQLIILDIMMPKMDGLSTMMKVREIKHPHYSSFGEIGGLR